MLVCKHGVALTAGARYSDTIEYKSRDEVCEFDTIAHYDNAETPEQFEARKAEMWRTKPKQ